jgi:hypothetical protein
MKEQIHHSKTHPATRRCDLHEITYDIWVDQKGQILSGHCPLCLEEEDTNIDKVLQDLDQQIQTLKIVEAGMRQKLESQRLYLTILPIWCFVCVLAIWCAMGYFLAGGFDRKYAGLAVFGVLVAGGLSKPLADYFYPLKRKYQDLQNQIRQLEDSRRHLLQKMGHDIRQEA